MTVVDSDGTATEVPIATSPWIEVTGDPIPDALVKAIKAELLYRKLEHTPGMPYAPGNVGRLTIVGVMFDERGAKINGTFVDLYAIPERRGKRARGMFGEDLGPAPGKVGEDRPAIAQRSHDVEHVLPWLDLRADELPWEQPLRWYANSKGYTTDKFYKLTERDVDVCVERCLGELYSAGDYDYAEEMPEALANGLRLIREDYKRLRAALGALLSNASLDRRAFERVLVALGARREDVTKEWTTEVAPRVRGVDYPSRE